MGVLGVCFEDLVVLGLFQVLFEGFLRDWGS